MTARTWDDPNSATLAMEFINQVQRQLRNKGMDDMIGAISVIMRLVRMVRLPHAPFISFRSVVLSMVKMNPIHDYINKTRPVYISSSHYEILVRSHIYAFFNKNATDNFKEITNLFASPENGRVVSIAFVSKILSIAETLANSVDRTKVDVKLNDHIIAVQNHLTCTTEPELQSYCYNSPMSPLVTKFAYFRELNAYIQEFIGSDKDGSECFITRDILGDLVEFMGKVFVAAGYATYRRIVGATATKVSIYVSLTKDAPRFVAPDSKLAGEPKIAELYDMFVAYNNSNSKDPKTEITIKTVASSQTPYEIPTTSITNEKILSLRYCTQIRNLTIDDRDGDAGEIETNAFVTNFRKVHSEHLAKEAVSRINEVNVLCLKLATIDAIRSITAQIYAAMDPDGLLLSPVGDIADSYRTVYNLHKKATNVAYNSSMQQRKDQHGNATPAIRDADGAAAPDDGAARA